MEYLVLLNFNISYISDKEKAGPLRTAFENE